MHPRRALWIVNHKTLLPAEVPVLRSLGYEVFIPKVIPQVSDYRSAIVTHDYDCSLSVRPRVLDVLNFHNFYERSWPTTLQRILNDNFSVLITSWSAYSAPLFEALRHFDGLIVARVFGREHPRRYTEFFDAPSAHDMPETILKAGNRFVFGQGFDALAEIEADCLKSRAHTITVPVPPYIWEKEGTWVGNENQCLFLCPNIVDSPYYKAIYEQIGAEFQALPYLIFGRQNIMPDDPHVLPYMSDLELLDLYARIKVFVYPSVEPRHVHYSPIEAMIVGAPVLFRKGGLLDSLGGNKQAGCCLNLDEMKAKASRLLSGEAGLLREIQEDQKQIVQNFSLELAKAQWSGLFSKHGY